MAVEATITRDNDGAVKAIQQGGVTNSFGSTLANFSRYEGSAGLTVTFQCDEAEQAAVLAAIHTFLAEADAQEGADA